MSEITDEEFQELGRQKIAKGVEKAQAAWDVLVDVAQKASEAFNNPNFLGGTPAELNDVAHIVSSINSQINMALQQREMQERMRAQIANPV